MSEATTKDEAPIERHVNERTAKLLQDAGSHSSKWLADVAAICAELLPQRGLPPESICFVVVGSVGRHEALQASDIDILPVTTSASELACYQPHDRDFRKALQDRLGVKVSQGEDLTKCVSVEELTDLEAIGGDRDCSSSLTKRMLILSEGRQAGGNLPLDNLRRKILDAYATAERTSGRHVLSLCNDIARYFKTLCIEYKAKADVREKDWCTRNIKLRHSRKFWYFSCMMAIVDVADSNPQGSAPYVDGLLRAFGKSPVQRLFDSVRPDNRGMAGRVVETYSWFLEFMACAERRSRLSEVQHDDRYKMSLDNPYHAVKLNSDRLHQDLLSLLESLPLHQRQRIISWFLL